MKARHDVLNTVRRHRLTRDMTQGELAELLGVTRQTVLSIEKGKYTPSIALALRLAEVFAVSVETLFQLDKESGNE
jgi:putative transcriptional regulator